MEGTTSAAGRAGQSRLPSLSSLAVRSFARERGRFLEGLILSPPPDGRTDGCAARGLTRTDGRTRQKVAAAATTTTAVLKSLPGTLAGALQ